MHESLRNKIGMKTFPWRYGIWSGLGYGRFDVRAKLTDQMQDV